MFDEPTKPSRANQTRILNKLRKMRLDGLHEMDDVESKDDVLIDDADYEEFVVEAVIGHFQTDKGFWFLIKWDGYAEPTWEHQSAIKAPMKVQTYFREICREEA